MRVTGDRKVCVGAGQCVLAAPGVFDQDEEEGLVLVLREEPGDDQRAEVQEAADTCPSGAVRID